MLQILTPRGELVGDRPVDLDDAADLYGEMVFARTYDRKGVALQKQGRIATYAPFEGQEAAQIGTAITLEPGDWMVPSYREPAAMWMHGYPMELVLATRRGTEMGGSPPASVRVLPPSIPVGSHMLHAVGLAWAERLQGTDRVAITYFGDGATSEGDFHEAMNFAGVFKAGCVFVCQNNGWAISLPRAEQTAAETIAAKAVGYGMPGVLVDGNDVFAVLAATSAAVARARAGEGPTLIEALTYRMGPHSTTDDPKRYRTDDELAEWRERDPLERLRRYLEAEGSWTPEWQAELEREGSARVERAVELAEQIQPFTAGETFDAMFAELPDSLLGQRAMAEEL
ncbi:pyruvate dehydrogenase (acetyl-transferring) E1 component subunit alpha [Kribbella shirazensis]|uniref:Pyruvate dehydrogenase E1 component alpha subunit n=1 Tax=Kribbella shirazensis TaxID=1105143 RepID=A0A7X5VHR3_9ACTN|nr:pyruvate dehydrogenase (acetyl-transferring) E1 component subunit alpha [Kribbella shirazensis]NIK61435.1 pyruvate dehydrogenase E1 component alpha subunit [Kribbella shirazensis]